VSKAIEVLKQIIHSTAYRTSSQSITSRYMSREQRRRLSVDILRESPCHNCSMVHSRALSDKDEKELRHEIDRLPEVLFPRFSVLAQRQNYMTRSRGSRDSHATTPWTDGAHASVGPGSSVVRRVSHLRQNDNSHHLRGASRTPRRLVPCYLPPTAACSLQLALPRPFFASVVIAISIYKVPPSTRPVVTLLFGSSMEL
jgi:hypothetical protein